MSAALAFLPPRTVEEFFDWAERQDERFEWDGVQPVAMTGGTIDHSELANRINVALTVALRGTPCRVFKADVGVRTANGMRVRFPDVVVTCSPVRRGARIVPDPVLVVEVLSESTAAVDRGVKRAEYGALPSMQRYVMLASDAAIGLVCERGTDFAEREEHAALRLPEFGLTLPFGELYAGLLD